jgi:hypothetical protein
VIAYGVDVLALELSEEGDETVRVSLNSDGAEDSSDVGGGWALVATEGEEEVCCEMLHFV